MGAFTIAACGKRVDADRLARGISERDGAEFLESPATVPNSTTKGTLALSQHNPFGVDGGRAASRAGAAAHDKEHPKPAR